MGYVGKERGIDGICGKGAENRWDMWERSGEKMGYVGKERRIDGICGKGAGNRWDMWERGGFSVQDRRHDSQVICQ